MPEGRYTGERRKLLILFACGAYEPQNINPAARERSVRDTCMYFVICFSAFHPPFVHAHGETGKSGWQLQLSGENVQWECVVVSVMSVPNHIIMV